MAKLKSPLLSFGASQSIADTLTFQKRSGTSFARRKPTPTGIPTTAQIHRRNHYREICLYWQTLSPSVKQQWETDARRHKITGFNYFMRTELNRLTNLVLCLPLDEGKGIIATDFSGKSNNGTIFGASWVDGIVDKALYFDGTDDRVDLPYAATLGLNQDELTVECWAYFPSLPAGYHAIIGGEAFYSGGGTFNLITSANTLYFILRNSGNTTYANASKTITIGWHHLIGRFNQGLITLHVDNNRGTDGTPPWTQFYLGDYPLKLGSNRNEHYFNGIIDIVKITPKAISITENP